MPILFLLFGILFIVASVRGEQEKLFDTLKSDFFGDNNFFFWVFSLWAIGAVGYYKPLKPLSVAFMSLVMLIFFMGAIKKGFFEKLLSQLGSSNDYSFSNKKYIPSINADKEFKLAFPNAIDINTVSNGGFAGPIR